MDIEDIGLGFKFISTGDIFAINDDVARRIMIDIVFDMDRENMSFAKIRHHMGMTDEKGVRSALDYLESIHMIDVGPIDGGICAVRVSRDLCFFCDSQEAVEEANSKFFNQTDCPF